MKDFKIYLSVGGALLLIYLIAQFNKPNPLNWSSTLTYNDKIPFGTYILYNRLHDIFPGAEITKTNQSAYSVFNDTTLAPGNYLIIAKTVELNKNDFKALLKYISAGNSVFISAFNWQGYITDSLKLDTKTEFGKKSVGLNFTNEHLHQADDYYFDKYISTQYFSEFDTTKAVVIGQNQYGHSNYLSFKFGKGTLYIFANPQILTNYSLLSPQGEDYATKVLSYLPVTDNVYWDQYQNHDTAVDESPMRVFFSKPDLQWAYYLSLAGILLFVAYEIKRRQRIIPVIEPVKNTTMEFASVVGKVYYEQRDNTNITAKKVLYFTEHLRNVYGLRAGNYNPEFITELINKTGVDAAIAQQLVNHINYLSVQTKITDHELIRLNQLIEKFYIQSGSYGK
jgi:hypothetical protein